jgi:hypothetical protein
MKKLREAHQDLEGLVVRQMLTYCVLGLIFADGRPGPISP